jgi:hypothetical protein
VTSQTKALIKEKIWTAFQLLQVASLMPMGENSPQLIVLTRNPKAPNQPKDMAKSAPQGIFRSMDGTSQRMLSMMETAPQNSVKVKPAAGQVLLWPKGMR